MTKEQLTSRERVRMALNHQVPDRIPRDMGGTPVSTITLGAYENLTGYLAKTENFRAKSTQIRFANKWGQTVIPEEEILQRFKIDTRPIYQKAPMYWRDMWYQNNTFFVDEWGILRQKSSDGNYYYYDVVGSPLSDAASIDELRKFRWPLGKDPGRVEGLLEEAKHLYETTDYALIGNLFGTDIFELCWFLRGFENFLIDLIVNKELAHYLLRTITDIQKDKIEMFLDAIGDYIDVVLLYDDLAMQNSLIVSAETYREMIKPYQKEIIDLIKGKTPAKLLYHTDGAVRPLINDLIEIGVDILQPVQVSAKGMESDSLKRDFGNQVVFWGGIDNQIVLPYGTPEEIRLEVEKRIAHFSPGGGYVFGAGHNIQFDVPPQNIVTLFDYAYEIGFYQ